MIMNKWLTKFFMYLDRYYVKVRSDEERRSEGWSEATAAYRPQL